MFIRRVLIRLLLLALCFHTVISMPAHEAAHLAQKIERASAASAVSAASAGETEAAGQKEQGASSVDSLCAWCLAFAHLSTAVRTAPIPSLAANDSPALPVSALAVGFALRLDRWRFAARDPPAPARG
jgi:cobalamin synthase